MRIKSAIIKRSHVTFYRSVFGNNESKISVWSETNSGQALQCWALLMVLKWFGYLVSLDFGNSITSSLLQFGCVPIPKLHLINVTVSNVNKKVSLIDLFSFVSPNTTILILHCGTLNIIPKPQNKGLKGHCFPHRFSRFACHFNLLICSALSWDNVISRLETWIYETYLIWYSSSMNIFVKLPVLCPVCARRKNKWGQKNLITIISKKIYSDQ